MTVNTVDITAAPSRGTKCPRCWHYHHVAENHDGLCDRCCLTMMADFPEHEETPYITEAWNKQRDKYTITETLQSPQGGA